MINVNSIKYWNWANQTKKSFLTTKVVSPPDIYILIPVFFEQQLIIKTIEKMIKLEYSGVKKIIIISTEKEFVSNGNKWTASTPRLVEDFIKNYKGDIELKHIHYPYKRGGKSEQLNYTLDLLREKIKTKKSTYIAVYDADSSPENQTLTEFLKLVSNVFIKKGEFPIAIQQPSLFVKNFNSISMYPKLEAIFQTRWSLGHELRTLNNSINFKNGLLTPYAYCVGHGMFIRSDFLYNTKGFSVPYDDIPMGQRLGFLGYPIYPLNKFDVSEVASSFKQILWQSSRWFGTGIIFREFLRTLKLNFKIKKVNTFT